MNIKSIVRYEAKVVFGLTTILPLLILPFHATVLAILAEPELGIPSQEYLQKTYEVVFPPMVALAAAHLMSIEREVRFAELRMSYPEPRWMLPLLRTGGALVLAGVALLLSALCLRIGYGPFSLSYVVLPSVAPALYLLGVALVINNLSGSYWVATSVVLGGWIFDVITRGRFTGILFLFEATWPRGEIPFAWNRALLVLLGVIFLAANAAISMWRHHPRRTYAG